jgi:hypothetical protein
MNVRLSYGTSVLRVFTAAALVALAAGSATAEQTIQGRTGLPTVRDGREKVWIEQGNVELRPQGADLIVTQNYTLRYPAPPTENGRVRTEIAVREDYYRARESHTPSVTGAEARGFSEFTVMVDGQPMDTRADTWHVNDKKDTATRWRSWNVSFEPGQAHQMQIVSRAPLGEQNGRHYVEFISKDLGHWRQSPDSLVVRYAPDDASDAHKVETAGVSPKPLENRAGQIVWSYQKGTPGRDVFILMPADGTDHHASL